ncbi:putative cytochrome P450 [Amniculicola lignicola CBS 123094]|uniref:Putative cytochrome P450 n=1 Tax=Amniculicola lignicola CBS 123094 TaxID=1392246 RepID=A0A6A5WQV3_9PLEO|nr:putative cytochrome P450 [Amniculicola lignicola CBS 123094]
MGSSLAFIALAIAGALLLLFLFVASLLLPPSNFPKNIPTIPFYYTLLPLFKDGDQSELYRQYLKKPLERYGAVKIFFGGRWNILVRKPSYIAEVFKHEDIYAKSGNQIKIPHSVLAEYTGENIISGHGGNWKLYTSIIKPVLQYEQDPTLIWRNARLLKKMLLVGVQSAPSGVVVYGLLQRYTLANLSDVLYESSFESMRKYDTPLHHLQLKIKPIIFNPIFLNFPFLDHFNFRTRQIGRQLVRNFRSTLRNEVVKGHDHICDPKSANLGCRLLGANNQGILTDKQLGDNLVSTFLAGHENPQLGLLSLMFLLGSHTDIQDRLRHEINSVNLGVEEDGIEPAYSAIHDLPYLTSVIYESLRMYPPISQLINRCTSTNTVLSGDIAIPKGTYIGYNAYSTNRDVDFWGVDADDFKPSRWGNTMEEVSQLYRKANAKGAFISFHGGRRACLGYRFAMQQLRITMVELLRGIKWEVDESWDRRMTPAGPLYPRNLRIRIQELKDQVLIG